MSSTYKLYYFPIMGRAEAVRIFFAYKGIKYEDVRIADWPEFKPKTPFGSMPVLEEDGKMLGGSLVILRYLGEKEGLAGSNEWENAQLGAVSDFVNDFTVELTKVVFEDDKELKKKLEERFEKEVIPKYLPKLNDMAGSDGYLKFGRLTWVDFQLFYIFHGIHLKRPDIADLFPNLMKLKSNLESNSNVSKWLAERPQTEY